MLSADFVHGKELGSSAPEVHQHGVISWKTELINSCWKYNRRESHHFFFFLITSWFSEAEMSKSQVRKEWWSFFPFFFKATGFKAHRFSHSSRLVVIQKKHVGSRCFERPFQTIGNSILWSYFMSSEPNNELIRPTISSVDTNKEADINSPD